MPRVAQRELQALARTLRTCRTEHGASAKALSKAELRKWGKLGAGRRSWTRKGLAALKRLATGMTQAECAAILGVSVRTIGTAVARMRP